MALGDLPAGEALYRHLSPYPHLHASAGPIYYGVAERPLGRLASLLGRQDEAQERLRRALEEHRRIGARYRTAVNEMDLAEVLVQVGGPENMAEAGALMDHARAVSEQGGYGSVLGRLEALG